MQCNIENEFQLYNYNFGDKITHEGDDMLSNK